MRNFIGNVRQRSHDTFGYRIFPAEATSIDPFSTAAVGKYRSRLPLISQALRSIQDNENKREFLLLFSLRRKYDLNVLLFLCDFDNGKEGFSLPH